MWLGLVTTDIPSTIQRVMLVRVKIHPNGLNKARIGDDQDNIAFFIEWLTPNLLDALIGVAIDFGFDKLCLVCQKMDREDDGTIPVAQSFHSRMRSITETTFENGLLEALRHGHFDVK